MKFKHATNEKKHDNVKRQIKTLTGTEGQK